MLALWLDPGCLAVYQEDIAGSDWLASLQQGIRFAIQGRASINRECIQLSANLLNELGSQWLADPCSPDSQWPLDFKELLQEKVQYIYMIFIAVKAEVSSLLSDALQPSLCVNKVTGMTAGDR